MTIHVTRRRLLHQGAVGTSAAAALSLLPRPLTAMLGGRHSEPIPYIQDERIKALVQRGLDAAKSAGATYADIRMTYTRIRDYGNNHSGIGSEDEALHVGVRALVDGYWGFATSPVWSSEELVRLGREATRQAKANTLGKPRDILLPPTVPVRDGHWETPVVMDPFKLHPDELTEYLLDTSERLRLMVMHLQQYAPGLDSKSGAFYGVTLQSKAFGATDGSYLTQRLMRSEASAGASSNERPVAKFEGGVEFTPVGAGWELFRNTPIEDLVRENMFYNQELARLPMKAIEVGRYATVFDAESMANVLSQTIGTATQLDRALGYEANAGGTSFLNEPLDMLGNYSLGSPLLTITANRNEVGGTATIKWDDEGTEPVPFTLVDRGVVSDFQTSREGAGWLKPASDRLQRPFLSNGCMYSETAKDLPSIHTPNLVLQPASTTASLKDLEAGISKGMSIMGFKPMMDFQAINGYSSNFDCFEIEGGKRVARIRGAGVLFRTQELWKGITAIGGTGSQVRYGLTTRKGQPMVESHQSVTAVPIALKELNFIDSTRR